MPNSGLMSKISLWLGGTLDNSTFPVESTAQCMCLVLVSEGKNYSRSKLFAGCWHEKIFFVFLCPGQEGFQMFILCIHVCPLNDTGTADNLFVDAFTQCSCEMGKCDSFILQAGNWSREKPRLRSVEILKSPVTLRSLKGKTPTPPKQPQSIS